MEIVKRPSVQFFLALSERFSRELFTTIAFSKKLLGMILNLWTKFKKTIVFGPVWVVIVRENDMQALVFVGYLILGLFQMAAVMAGLEHWLGLHWIIAIPLALFIAYIPVVGSIVGIFGAVSAWHWSWLQAGALFFGPLVVVGIAAIAMGIFEKSTRKS